MTHLGDLGTDRDPVDFTFGYFGATIRVHPDLSDVAVLDLFAGLDGLDDDPVKQASVLRGIGAALVHPEDFDGFWRITKERRQTVEDIMALSMKIIEGVTDRPTSLPSDSSAGRQHTDTSSTDDSSSRALRLLEGRPDLQVAVVQADAARQAG